jgi:hypothetical protein
MILKAQELVKRKNMFNDFLLFFQLDPVGAGHPKPRVFSYNVVFEPGATQEDVLQFSGIKRLIEMAVEGFSTTAFCYGQTGSGKTHTLTGPPGLVSSLTNIPLGSNCVPFFLADILQRFQDSLTLRSSVRV